MKWKFKVENASAQQNLALNVGLKKKLSSMNAFAYIRLMLYITC